MIFAGKHDDTVADKKHNHSFPDYIIHMVPPNGNCLFSALSHQLSIGTGHEPSSSQLIRQQLIDYIKLHPSIFENVPENGLFS